VQCIARGDLLRLGCQHVLLPHQCDVRPDPDFQAFALDCIRLSNQEKSPRLRHRLLMLAREWMHAAMHRQGAELNRESTERMDANSGEPWSEMDISDLTNEIVRGRTMAETASFLCRDEDEVRQKAMELGLLERPGKHVRVVL
jgi:hypothetical protein